MHYRILIVEDDLTIARNLYDYFDAQGWAPDAAYDGAQALSLLEQHCFDAVVLDLGLPGTDGLHVLRTLREETASTVPVLILTARDTLGDKLGGFALGADDYLTKPFALAEVSARLQALIQRSHGAVVSTPRRCGTLLLDPRTLAVSMAGQPVRLTRKSSQLLGLLMRHPGHTMGRSDLEHALWGDNPPSSDALRSQMHLLRRALADAGFDGIETVHGQGWRLVCPTVDAP